MVQRGSYLSIVDNNGIILVGVFHIYKGFCNKIAYFGSFLKVSVKQVLASYLVLKKCKFKSLLIQTSFKQLKNDGSFLKYKFNSSVILKRRLSPLGKDIFGPCNFNLFRRRFMFSFVCII